MPEREELILEVEVDDNRAESKLRDIERAADDVEEAFEDTGTAAERAGRALVQSAEDTRSGMVQAKAAADALATALGPDLTAKADVDQIVTDLQRMGLTLEDIKAEADTLATSLKEADAIRLQGLSQGVDITRRNMDGLRSSSDQSRSVLANLAGNAAQDLGELGGVAGTVGVAIGQLAEYAVDGNIALGNLAKVVGPILGVASAISVVSGLMADQKAQAAAAAAQVEKFGEALASSADNAVGIGDALRGDISALQSFDAHAASFGGLVSQYLNNIASNLPLIGGLFEDAGVNIIDVLNQTGLSLGDLSRATTDAEFRWGDFLDVMQAALAAGRISHDEYEALAQVVDRMTVNVDAAADAQRIFNVDAAEANRILAEITKQADPLSVLPEQWRILVKDVADGNIEFAHAEDRINALAEATGLTATQVIELARAEAEQGDQLEKTTGVVEQAVVAQQEHTAALRETSAALAETVAGMDTAARRGSAFSSALGDINRNFSELDASGETITFVERLRDLGSALREVADFEGDLVPDSWGEVLNMPEELGPVQDALRGFRDIVQSEFTQAFEQGGSTEAREWAESTRAAIIEELDRAGIEAPEKVEEILAALGLLPEQVETTIVISNAEQAKSILSEIGSALSSLPASVQTQIALLAPTDPVAALDLAIEALQNAGVTVPVSLIVQAEQLGADIDSETAKLSGKSFGAPQIVLTTGVDPTGADEGIAEITDAEYVATIVAEADTEDAEADLAAAADAERTADIDVNALLGDFEREMAFAVRDRTATVDVATGNVSIPTAAQLRSLATGGRGYIEVPLVGRWSTRIEGSRPR